MTSDFSSDKVDWPYENPIPTAGANTPRSVGGRYELLELVGWGATSRIYRAQDQKLKRIVAVKLLREEYGRDQNSVTRFYREAQAVASLPSQHIVDVFDYGEYGDTYFIAMEYVEGLNLKELLKRQGQFEPEQAVSIINQVLLALKIAHSRGIIHRDVKPQNILVQSGDGIVKLTDFGVAHARDNVNITTLGAAIGTVHYMAPEQASGGKIGPATDLYAVGVVLYELLAGQLPFEGTNQMQIALQHLNNPAPSFNSLGVSVLPRLERVVQRALAKNPAQRYASAEEMRQELLRSVVSIEKVTPGPAPLEPTTLAPLVRPRPVAPVQPTRSYQFPLARDGGAERKPSNRLWLPLLLLGLLVLGGLGVWLATSLGSGGNSRAITATPPVAQVVSPTARGGAVGSGPGTTATPQTTTAPVLAPTAPPLPSATPVPATPTVQPTQAPTATAVPPTATPSPTQPPTVPVTVQLTTSTSTTAATISPYGLEGSYKRDDGKLYGRAEVSLYGTGSNYEQGTLSFKLDRVADTTILLRLTGLDDERAERCNLQVTLNGVSIFNGPNTFPNAPTNDNGEGGSNRFWGQMIIVLPDNLLKAGTNTLTLRNNTPWAGYLGIPYILISSIEIVNRD